MDASGNISYVLIAGIILGAVLIIISVIILIWFIVTLNDMKRYLRSIDAKFSKTNLNLTDIKLYIYQLANDAQPVPTVAAGTEETQGDENPQKE